MNDEITLSRNQPTSAKHRPRAKGSKLVIEMANETTTWMRGRKREGHSTLRFSQAFLLVRRVLFLVPFPLSGLLRLSYEPPRLVDEVSGCSGNRGKTCSTAGHFYPALCKLGR